MERFERSELLLGADGMAKLKKSRIAVFGIGGVGGYAAEALARTGVGALDIIDGDTVGLSNVNRQIIATDDTLGRYKTDVMKERILSINPDCKVTALKLFYLGTPLDMLDFSQFDYVLDAIDTVTGKLAIIENARAAGVPVISCMGAGNKLNPMLFGVADIEKTSVCPLAKVMRRELKKRGIAGVKAVYSKEVAKTPEVNLSDGDRRTVGSLAFVTPVAGLIAACEIVKDLCGIKS